MSKQEHRVSSQGGKYFTSNGRLSGSRRNKQQPPRALTSRRPDFNLNAFAARISQKYGGSLPK